MKVLLVNGSPHRKGETYNALSLVETALNEKVSGRNGSGLAISLQQPLPVVCALVPIAR